jgi:mRNA-degrading endonuclease toxin of MazEF toxin-antitoxin module
MLIGTKGGSTNMIKLVVKRGDIFYADLTPSIGSEMNGIRPVVIVQNDLGNAFSPTVIVASITSGTFKTRIPIQVEISANEFGLNKKSVIRLDQVRTIDKIRLKEKIGELDKETIDKVSKAWCVSGGVTEFNESIEKQEFEDYYNFVLGTKFDFIEDIDYEFKEVNGPSPRNSVNSTIAIYSASFLNSKGGRIYYGITDDRIVKGVHLTLDQYDEINKTIYNNIANINPALSPDYYHISYHPVYDIDRHKIENLIIVEVAVPPSPNENTIHFVNGNELYVRVRGVKKKLIGNEIVSFIRKKIISENSDL